MAKQPPKSKTEETTPAADAPATPATPEAPAPAAPVKAAKVERLEAENAELKARIAALEGNLAARKTTQPAELPEEFKGEKLYKLTRDTYRKGLLKAGTIIRVTDEVPGKTWVEIDESGKPVKQE